MECLVLNIEWILVVILVIVVFCLCFIIAGTKKEVDFLKDKVKAMQKMAESDQENIRTLKRHIEKLQYEIVELKCK